MSDIKVIIPVIGFRKMTDTVVYDFGVLRKNDLVANVGVFGAVVPTTADLDTQLTDYANALAAFRPGDKHSTRVKNEERLKLEVMLREMAWSCVGIADGDFTVFALSGYAARQKGVAHTSIDTPLMVGLVDGPLANTLKVKFKAVVYKKVYEIQVSTDELFPAGNVTTAFSESSSPFIIPNLQSDVRYYVRVRAIGARGLLSDWSLTATRKLQ